MLESVQSQPVSHGKAGTQNQGELGHCLLGSGEKLTHDEKLMSKAGGEEDGAGNMVTF